MNTRSFLASLVAIGFATVAHAQPTNLTVLHGIPGLGAPVEVFANGGSLFSFDYTDVRGPLTLPAGRYAIEVRLNGQVVLAANPTLTAGVSYSAIAHLSPTGTPTLSLFENDITPIASGQSRVVIRHTAEAGPVDIGVTQNGNAIATLGPLANPNQIAASLPFGGYDAEIFAAGTSTSVLGPLPLALAEGVGYYVYAVGEALTPTFTVLVQTIDLTREFAVNVRGTSCGGALTTSTRAVGGSDTLNLFLSSATPDAPAMLMFGASDSRIDSVPLPIDLGSFGAPGCSLYIDVLASIGLRTNSLGLAALSITIPTDAAVFIDSAYFQWAFMAQSQNALGMQTTDYVELIRQ